jgi:iron complex transport system ATP-binding protein
MPDFVCKLLHCAEMRLCVARDELKRHGTKFMINIHLCRAVKGLQAIALQTGYPGAGNPLLVDPLSFEAAQGSLWVLAGHNGAGKSTLLHTLCGLLPAYRGMVCWNEQPVANLDPLSRSAIFALVFTARPAAASFTGSELVGTALFRRRHLSEKERQDRIMRALETSGAAHLSAVYFGKMSDGEKQRVLLARALAQDTPVLLLDEPSAFLDFAAKRELAALLQQLAHEFHKLVIVSTHDTEVFLPRADDLLFLDKNRVGRHLPHPAGNPETAGLFHVAGGQ